MTRGEHSPQAHAGNAMIEVWADLARLEWYEQASIIAVVFWQPIAYFGVKAIVNWMLQA